MQPRLFSLPGVAEVAARVTPRRGPAPHFHETYCVGIFLEPTTIFCRDRYWRIGPRHIAVLEPREAHGGRSAGVPCPQDAIYPDPGLLEAWFGASEPIRFADPVIEDPPLAADLSLAAGSGDPHRMGASLRVLFTQHGVRGRPAARTDAMSATLRAALGADPGRSLIECSRAAGLSPSHYSRQVRARLGLSLRDYRRQLRVLAASARIASGQTLSQAAHESGFADQAHMTRQMRAMLGATPGQFARARSSPS